MGLLAVSLFGSVTTLILDWDIPSVNPSYIGYYKIYGVPGTNIVFMSGNTNATVVVSITNQLTTTLTNLGVGQWSFVATAVGTNNLESLNSDELSTYVTIDGIVGFRILNTITQ